MPSVNDIVAVAEALEKRPITVVQDRCAAVRNRNASCRLCEDVCCSDVFSVYANEVHVDMGACMGCGACVGACPTEAIVALDPPDSLLVEQLERTADAECGNAALACSRIASKRQGDPGKYAEVPCLARVEESILLHALDRCGKDVILIDGDCATCKLGKHVRVVDERVERVNALALAQANEARVVRRTGFPASLQADSDEDPHGSTRRGFFSEAVEAAKDTALTAARATIGEKLGIDAEAGIGQRLRVSDDGTMRRFAMPRHERAINALYDLDPLSDTRFPVGLFAAIAIDVERCNSCGMCVTFCPTKALASGDKAKRGTHVDIIEFSASDCVNCGLCKDVCWKGCITIEPYVDAGQLFDFEPRIFDIAKAHKRRKA